MTAARSRHAHPIARGSAPRRFVVRKRAGVALTAVVLAASVAYSRDEYAEAASMPRVNFSPSKAPKVAAAESVSIRLSE